MLKFDSSQNYVKQDFSLSSPIIRYLMINANPDNLDALYKTCKYFYSKFKINIVDCLCLDSEEDLVKEPLTGPYDIRLYNHQLDKLPNNLWLTDHLLLGNNINFVQLFSKIVRCDLQKIYLALDSKFTINEWKILTHSGTIEACNIDMPIYISENNDIEAPLEDILSYVLNAHSIGFGNDCYTTKETMKKLMQLNFQQKLKEFRLCGINQMLDANLMNVFLKKNLVYKAGVSFIFNNENENHVFNLQMFEKINAWIPEERKPRTFPKFFIVQ